MSLAPKGVGAEPKKLAILVVLLVAAAGTYYWMSRPDTPAGANSAPASATSTVSTPVAPAPSTSSSAPRPTTSSYGPRTATRGGRTSSSGDDFRPTLKLPDGMDVSRIDPTLKLDLMAKVRAVSVEGGSRSLFEFYTPPPPPPPPVPKPQPIVPKPLTAAEQRAAELAKGPPPPPPPPPIPLKFYGYSGALRSNVRRAFFLSGEDIVQAGENETLLNRYKIIRIGVNSAVVEDTVAKNQQTLPLADEAQ
ncbi:MAG: hypothetical protein LAP61_01220 [Acidobacteriia bacterium]|nr:hypothetical protein [Terriglobia bacterium]